MTDIEKLCVEEWPEGRSAGAAAREICRSLGCSNGAPTLKKLLEELLGDLNHKSFDRSVILREFDDAAPAEAKRVRHESFLRLNGRAA